MTDSEFLKLLISDLQQDVIPDNAVMKLKDLANRLELEEISRKNKGRGDPNSDDYLGSQY